ncbi:hypothetical protein MSIMFI_04408 [Mycobacterium simulans]|uniref:hypothetical protein n=1 Tax=Mycobacterium simulans TaxID=627089 RepID=UPI00174B39A2|nr:hypothetical protein [Mycobacterium simulans]SON62878.1 hypothetical protein MSIMFI_04408 [Mycobacterium simulans]
MLIGGYAALLRGSGFATIDIDIVPDRTARNLANLAAALNDLDAKIRAAGTDGLPFSATAGSLQGISVLNLTTRFGDLDLAFSPSGFSAGFNAMRPAATTMTVDGVSVLVASLDDVITSKEAAGRDKDFQTLPDLIRLQQEHQKSGGRD